MQKPNFVTLDVRNQFINLMVFDFNLNIPSVKARLKENVPRSFYTAYLGRWCANKTGRISNNKSI